MGRQHQPRGIGNFRKMNWQDSGPGGEEILHTFEHFEIAEKCGEWEEGNSVR